MEKHSQKLLEFLERSGPPLYALLTRLTLRQDVAEDLMQELFIRLSNSRALDNAQNHDAYARRCAINLAFDWRQRSRQDALPLDGIRELASNDNSPLAKLIQKEELEEVLDAIGKLTGLSREAFIMRYIEQYSNEEIARQVGREPHQVRALCSRAMAQLRSIVNANKSSSTGKGMGNA
ncbi:MAG TPA: sigma-70 family RNA polymerase sigma factor [Sedimentisphaerales bacterium]|nr:sigma-70 family RNA polymerase sigma factor [Sedimentisphaerales bacterium]